MRKPDQLVIDFCRKIHFLLLHYIWGLTRQSFCVENSKHDVVAIEGIETLQSFVARGSKFYRNILIMIPLSFIADKNDASLSHQDDSRGSLGWWSFWTTDSSHQHWNWSD
jgi:hypothetical protein